MHPAIIKNRTRQTNQAQEKLARPAAAEPVYRPGKRDASGCSENQTELAAIRLAIRCPYKGKFGTVRRVGRCRRGKQAKPNQFGRLATVYEDGAGFITHYHIMTRDAQGAEVAVEQTRIYDHLDMRDNTENK